jgi:uncharacterized protein (DUF4415 family)
LNGDDISQEMTPEREAELRYLSELPDDQIDTSDIPEITDAQWATARRGALFRPVKTPVTIRLDADLLEWYKEHAENGRYQTEINRALRLYMQEAIKKAG